MTQDGEQGGGKGGDARRPRVIIEGSAREVASGTEAPSSAMPKEEPTESASKGPEGANDPAVQTDAEDTGRATGEDRGALLRQSATVGAIAAVVVVIAVVLLLTALRYGSDTTSEWVRMFSGAQAPRDAVAALGGDVDALRARLTAQERFAERLTTLETRAGRIEADVRALSNVGAAVEQASVAGVARAERITALETRLESLDAAAAATSNAVGELRSEIVAAAESGASAAAVATRLSREVTRIDGLESRIGGFEQNLSAVSGEAGRALAAAQEAADSQDVLAARLGGGADGTESFASRLGVLESTADQLRGRLDDLALPAAVVAHGALVRKVESGAMFERELEALAAALGNDPALETLRPYATRNIPTPDMLADRLAGLERNTDDAGKAAGGFFDQLIERAGKAVRVRRIGSAALGGDLGRAEELLESGDIAGAAAIVREIDASPARDAWLADVDARLAVQKALAGVNATLDARLAAAGER